MREALADEGYEDTVVFENPSYDTAIIGVSYDGRAIYDYELMNYMADERTRMESRFGGGVD